MFSIVHKICFRHWNLQLGFKLFTFSLRISKIIKVSPIEKDLTTWEEGKTTPPPSQFTPMIEYSNPRMEECIRTVGNNFWLPRLTKFHQEGRIIFVNTLDGKKCLIVGFFNFKLVTGFPVIRNRKSRQVWLSQWLLLQCPTKRVLAAHWRPLCSSNRLVTVGRFHSGRPPPTRPPLATEGGRGWEGAKGRMGQGSLRTNSPLVFLVSGVDRVIRPPSTHYGAFPLKV